MKRLSPGIVGALLVVMPAFANSDGAPWGAADPNAQTTCTSCHFDGEAVVNSEDLKLYVVPSSRQAGEYRWFVRATFDPAVIKTAGYLVRFSQGQLIASNKKSQQVKGQEIRSTKTVGPEGFQFLNFYWRPTDKDDLAVDILLAVNAANDDASPFGDEIHYRRFSLPNPVATKP